VPEDGERTLPDAASSTSTVPEMPSNPVPATSMRRSPAHAIPSADLRIVGGHGGQIDDYARLQTWLGASSAE
jgi:hypothetical protein